VKLTIKVQGCALPERMARNMGQAPDLPEPSGSGRLVVVGGGPSIAYHANELRALGGDIWAINGAALWCQENGIRAWLFSADPDPILADIARLADRAVLADHCDPSAFAAMAGRPCLKAVGDMPGPTSALGASAVALRAGYDGVTYFGCECSYTDRTHAYQEEDPPDLVRVSCGGESFLTKLELLLQAERMAELIRELPDIYSERCGGLLSALIKHGDYDVTHGSRALHREVKFS
jgi:hypothetical protein